MNDLLNLLQQAETNRQGAMLKGDVAALDRCLSNDLVYVHATGLQDTKEAMLRRIASGSLVFRSLEERHAVAYTLGSAGIRTSELILDVEVMGAPKHLHTRAVALWAIEDDAWVLRHYQATAIPPPAAK